MAVLATVHHLGAAREDHAARLEAAGWEPKVRLGKTIWRDPAGGWYSLEMALTVEDRRRSRDDGEE